MSPAPIGEGPIASLVLPPALAARGIGLRDEAATDLAFLEALYAATRADEVAHFPGWSEAQRAAFLAMQFRAQRQHYRTALRDCRFAVIERDGRPIGRLYLEDREATWSLVDISLLADQRSGGIGTALIQAVIVAATRADKPVDLYVERANPAYRLYSRLGFVEIGDTGVYRHMQRAIS